MKDYLNFDEQPLKLASRKRRIAAYFFDYLLLAIPVVLAVSSALNDPEDVRVLTVVSLGMLLLFFAKDCMDGRSPGKRLMGIMVRDRDDVQQVPSAGRLLLRNVLLVIWPIEFIVMCTNDEKQRLGDKAAKTQVMRSPEPLKVWPRVAVAALVGIALFATLVISISNGLKNSIPYQMSLEEIHSNPKIAEYTGGVVEIDSKPIGSIQHKDGQGNAHFTFRVKGKNKNMIVYTFLSTNSVKEWKFTDVRADEWKD